MNILLLERFFLCKTVNRNHTLQFLLTGTSLSTLPSWLTAIVAMPDQIINAINFLLS